MRKLNTKTRTLILRCLVEGMSIRSTARTADVSKNTVMKLMVDAGKTCAAYQDRALRDLPCRRIQVDEIWSFIYAKDKNVERAKAAPAEAGDVWTWTAIDAETKLVPSWRVGDRSGATAIDFMDDLRARLANRVQLTSDGHRAYLGVCAAEVLAADRLPVAVAELVYRVWLGAWAVPWPGGGRGQSEPSKADRPHAACHHTSSPCRARGNSAPDCPHHAAIAARRLMFSARHTRCHSPRTLSKPRRLNRRNPSTSLTQPFGPSDIHLRLAY